MDSTDILFKTDNYIFSYRVAGILIQNGKLLLQKPQDDTGYAFPGGHASFGETNEETLIREFMEEISAPIRVKNLKWVGEIFFPWKDKPCHQICLYYQIELVDETQIPLDGRFFARESLEGKSFGLEFFWVQLDTLHSIKIYPPQAEDLVKHLDDGIQHFVYREPPLA